jgi:hypothetical protein
MVKFSRGRRNLAAPPSAPPAQHRALAAPAETIPGGCRLHSSSFRGIQPSAPPGWGLKAAGGDAQRQRDEERPTKPRC